MQRSGDIVANLAPSKRSLLSFALMPAIVSLACSSSEKSGATGADGGQPSATGGATSGGSQSGAGASGREAGGATTGGSSSGGRVATGGAAPSSGGTAGGSGGTGGATTGGATTGGDPGMGGMSTGGSSSPGTTYVYVSGSDQLSIFTLDEDDGTLTPRGQVDAGSNANYLAISSDKRFLYLLNEQNPSRVVAYAIDPNDGSVEEINQAETTGDGAPHITVHPSGKWLVVPHYNSGHIDVFAVRDDGGVGGVTTTSRGPNDGCQKAHQAVFDESGEHLFVPCLGSNYVIQYRFASGMLEYNDPPTVPVTGGPRHLALSPTAPFAYVLGELNSTITQLGYDATLGRLSNPTSIPSVEATPGSSAHIAVHPSGKYLYASNRTENSIGAFSLDASTGKATPIAFERSMISTPRDFGLAPSGRFLVSANQAGQQDLIVYRIDPDDGRLMRLANVPVGGRPVCVVFVTVP